MSTHTLRFLKRLSTLLQKLGWTEDDIDLINDSPMLRDQINKEIKRFAAMQFAHVEVPEIPSREGVERFLRAIHGRVWEHDLEELARRTEGVHKLMQPNALRELFSVLDARSQSILVMRLGLQAHMANRTLAQTGEVYGISGSAIRIHEGKALHKLRDILIPKEPKDPDSIESLGLSERPYMCLRRARIYTVTLLITKCEDDLLAITNFGMKSLEEVKQKLAERGLSLKDA